MKSATSLAIVALTLSGVNAQVVGISEEDACASLEENESCQVMRPNMQIATGYCVWSTVATEGPDETAAPNPANVACLALGLSLGDTCDFIDLESGVEVTGACVTSNAVGYDGLVCNPDGNSEISEDVMCDNKSVGDACTITRGDGASVDGTCTEGGQALKCVENEPSTGNTNSDSSAPLSAAEQACMVDANNINKGFLVEGTSCSFLEGSTTTEGTCESKNTGNEDFMTCESVSVGSNSTVITPEESGDPEFTACEGFAVDDACEIDDPLGGDPLDGTCVIQKATGDLKCQAGRRDLSAMFLTCHITSGGAETTKASFGATQTTVSDTASFQDDAGAVVGGVIGGLLAAALLAVGGVFVYRRYGKRKLGVDLDTEGGEIYQTL